MTSADQNERKIILSLLAFRFARRRQPQSRFLRRPAWDVLLRIALGTAEAAPISVSEVRDVAVTSQSTTLRIIAELELEGLVQRVRRSSDRRIIWLQLTPRGRRYVSGSLQ